MSKARKPQPPRRDVLVVIDGDYMEVYGEPGVRVHVAQIPQTGAIASEALAEVCMTLALPPNFRRLYRADYMRANASTFPISASTARAAIQAAEAIDALNAKPRRRSRPKRKRRRPLA